MLNEAIVQYLTLLATRDDSVATRQAICSDLSEILSPRSLPDQAVDALLRAVHSEPNIQLRLRAVLALLIYTGLRVQKVCDVQLRDVDLTRGTITVRSGKGSKARRIPLHPDAEHILQRYLKEVRCPNGFPWIGSDEERKPFLVGMQITLANHPLSPGIKTRIIRQRVANLGHQAAIKSCEAAKREHDMQRAELQRTSAQFLESVSPHVLRPVWHDGCSKTVLNFLKYSVPWDISVFQPLASISSPMRTMYSLLDQRIYMSFLNLRED